MELEVRTFLGETRWNKVRRVDDTSLVVVDLKGNLTNGLLTLPTNLLGIRQGTTSNKGRVSLKDRAVGRREELNRRSGGTSRILLKDAVILRRHVVVGEIPTVEDITLKRRRGVVLQVLIVGQLR